jgi:hypothetical protein
MNAADDNSEPDDLVAVKNVPSQDSFTIVRIDGQYDYKIDSRLVCCPVNTCA